jgi:hypothetical protein
MLAVIGQMTDYGYRNLDIAVIFAGINDKNTPSTWVNGTIYQKYAIVKPTTPNGYYFMQVADAYSGTSGGSEPSWVTTVHGSVTTDNTCTWVAILNNAQGIQANIQAMIRSMQIGADGYVYNETLLPALQPEGTTYVVVDDTSTTGGLLPGLSGTHAGVQVWRSVNASAGVAGWGRVDVTTITPKVTKFLLVRPHFLNYSAGGDTVNTGHTGQNANSAAVDTAVLAAYTAEAATAASYGISVSNFDAYTYLQARIVAGKDTAGDHAWHVADSNLHFSRYGWDLIASGLLANIQGQSTWLAALASRS